MKDNLSVMEADLDYAERMVRTGFATSEHAAQACGVRLTDLQARLADGKQPGPTQQERLFRTFDA
jgi:hypothetical protein